MEPVMLDTRKLPLKSPTLPEGFRFTVKPYYSSSRQSNACYVIHLEKTVFGGMLCKFIDLQITMNTSPEDVHMYMTKLIKDNHYTIYGADPATYPLTGSYPPKSDLA